MPGFRSYNAFLRSAKSQKGLSHRQSQDLYRALKGRLDRSPNRLDLRKHPKITSQELKRVSRLPPSGKAAREERRRASLAPSRPKKAIRSIEEYEDLSDLDYDIETIAAGVDTGRSKKK